MQDKERKAEKSNTEDQPPAAADDVYFFNPWDEEFARDMENGNAQFEY